MDSHADKSNVSLNPGGHRISLPHAGRLPPVTRRANEGHGDCGDEPLFDEKWYVHSSNPDSDWSAEAEEPRTWLMMWLRGIAGFCVTFLLTTAIVAPVAYFLGGKSVAPELAPKPKSIELDRVEPLSFPLSRAESPGPESPAPPADAERGFPVTMLRSTPAPAATLGEQELPAPQSTAAPAATLNEQELLAPPSTPVPAITIEQELSSPRSAPAPAATLGEQELPAPQSTAAPAITIEQELSSSPRSAPAASLSEPAPQSTPAPANTIEQELSSRLSAPAPATTLSKQELPAPQSTPAPAIKTTEQDAVTPRSAPALEQDSVAPPSTPGPAIKAIEQSPPAPPSTHRILGGGLLSVLSRVSRLHKLLAGHQAERLKVLRWANLDRVRALKAYLAPLHKIRTGIYHRSLLRSSQAALGHLSRYAHRVIISSVRLIASPRGVVKSVQKSIIKSPPRKAQAHESSTPTKASISSTAKLPLVARRIQLD
jgi:hypothetical protein